jgi:hypothetical protein
MTGMDYGNAQYPQQYTMQYDANGRLGGMQEVTSGLAPQVTATYGVAGEMVGLTYQGPDSQNYYLWPYYTETRTYNAMLQMTRQTATGGPYSPFGNGTVAMDQQYVYMGGANNGRIAQSIDGVAGETVNYTYDALNRLATRGRRTGRGGRRTVTTGSGI